MDPVLKAVLLSWEWRITIITVLAFAGTLYFRGWRLLRARTRRGTRLRKRAPLAATWRPVSYLVGLLFIALSLMSPIDPLGQQLFLFHMIQHLLLIMIAPPLLLIANPLPFILWGMPHGLRLQSGRLLARALHPKSGTRRRIRTLTSPGIVWLFWVVSLYAWHDPNAYNGALQNEWIHDLEHLSFFIASTLFWWHVTGAGPRIHPQLKLPGRIALVISAVPPNMILGVVLAFARTPIYSYYTTVPRLWGISVMADQQIGGLIMWIPGSMMFIIAALILIARLLDNENSKANSARASVQSDEALSAL